MPADQRPSRVLHDLQQAAASRPLKLADYEQASQLLISNADDAPLCCATLHALHTALSTHSRANPGASPAALVASPLLPTLAALLTSPSHPSSAQANTSSPDQVLLADAVGALMTTLLAPPLHTLHSSSPHSPLSEQHLALMCTNWRSAIMYPTNPQPPINPQLSSSSPSLLQLLFTHALPILRPADTQSYHAAASAARALLMAGAGSGPAAYAVEAQAPWSPDSGTPGAQALLGCASIAALWEELQMEEDPAEPFDAYALAPSPGVLHLKLVMLLERELAHYKLPDGALTGLLRTILEQGKGALCQPLTRSKAALATLASPLEALTAGTAAPNAGPFTRHLDLLQRLLQWGASVLGLRGLEAMAQHLARPVVESLDAVLKLESGRHAGGQHARQVLKLMEQLAVTSPGRVAIAKWGHMARWLLQAVKWHRSSNAQEVPVLLLRVFNAATSNPKKDKHPVELYYNGTWQQGVLEVEPGTSADIPQALRAQLESRHTLQALATLLQASADDVHAKHRLVQLLSVMFLRFNFKTMQPVVAALLSICSVPATMAAEEASQEKQAGLHPGTSSTDRQLALNMLVSYHVPAYYQDINGAASMAAARPLEDAALKWLEAFAAGAMPSGSLETPRAHCLLAGTLHDLVAVDLVRVDLLVRKLVIRRLASLTQHFTTDKEWLAGIAALHLVFDKCTSFGGEGGSRLLLRQHEKLSARQLSSWSQLEVALAAPQVLDRLLDQIAHNWELVKASDSSSKGPCLSDLPAFACSSAAVVSSKERMEFVDQAVDLLQAAASSKTWLQEPAPTLKLLNAAAIWEAAAVSASSRRARGGAGHELVLSERTTGKLYDAFLAHVGGFSSVEVVSKCGQLLQEMDQQLLRARLQAMPAGARESRELWIERWAGVQGDEAKVTQGAGSSSGSSSGSGSSSSSSIGRGKEGSGAAATRSSAGSSAAAKTGAGHTRDKTSSGTGNGGINHSQSSAACAAEMASAGGAAATTAAAASGGQCGMAGESAARAERACSVCNMQLDELFLCSRCKSVRYCSAECQRAGWKAHKKVCKPQ